MKATDVLRGLGVALDTMAKGVKDPIERVAHEGAATILRAVVDLFGDKTPEQCAAVLKQLRDHGAQAISQPELDAQVAAAIARGKDG